MYYKIAREFVFISAKYFGLTVYTSELISPLSSLKMMIILIESDSFIKLVLKIARPHFAHAPKLRCVCKLERL